MHITLGRFAPLPYALLLVVTLFPTGCKPMRACVNATVRPQWPSVGTNGPVVATTLPGRTPCADAALAIIDVDGLLLNAPFTGVSSAGENPVSLFRERLQAAGENPCVRGVVVRINSPGGGVTACDIMRRDLVAFKQRTGLPVVACLMDVAAGGAYYVATAADLVVAHPTTVTGGIGVILNVYNLQDAMAQFNVVAAPVKAGGNIDLGSPVKALTTEQRSLLQNMADEFHVRFQDTVRESRPLLADDETLFDGRVFTARQAQESGLVDRIGYLDESLVACRNLAGCGPTRTLMLHRAQDTPHTAYDITPNQPLQTSLFPLSLPGLDRTRLPTFLYLWQIEPTAERLSGR